MRSMKTSARWPVAPQRITYLMEHSMKLVALLAILALSACGVDDPSVMPAGKQQPGAITLNGDARIGVSTE